MTRRAGYGAGRTRTLRSAAGQKACTAVIEARQTENTPSCVSTRRWDQTESFKQNRETRCWHSPCSDDIGSLRRLMKVLSCWAAAPSAGKWRELLIELPSFDTAQALTA